MEAAALQHISRFCFRQTEFEFWLRVLPDPIPPPLSPTSCLRSVLSCINKGKTSKINIKNTVIYWMQFTLEHQSFKRKKSPCALAMPLSPFSNPHPRHPYSNPHARIKSLANPAVSSGILPNCLANEMEISETNTVAMISPSSWTIQRNGFIYSCDAYESVLNIDIIYIAVIEWVYISQPLWLHVIILHSVLL